MGEAESSGGSKQISVCLFKYWWNSLTLKKRLHFLQHLCWLNCHPPQGKRETGIVFELRCAAFKVSRIFGAPWVMWCRVIWLLLGILSSKSLLQQTQHIPITFELSIPTCNFQKNVKLMKEDMRIRKTPTKKSLRMGMLSQLWWSSGRSCSISLAIEAPSCYLNILTCHQRKGEEQEWLHWVILSFKPPLVLFSISTGRCLCFRQAGGLPLSAASLLRSQVSLNAPRGQQFALKRANLNSVTGSRWKGCISKVILFFLALKWIKSPRRAEHSAACL